MELEKSASPNVVMPKWRDVQECIFKKSSIDNTISNRKGVWSTLRPFSSWSESALVMKKDYDDTEKCIIDLVDLFESAGANRKVAVQNLSLAAKNRAELLSQKSDFYPVGITICIAFFGLLAVIPPPTVYWVKTSFVFFSALVVFIYGVSRFNSRSQVADLKIIANILDAVEKRLK
ncbi:hypothetical protein [Hydrogenophaga sp.]|uniref:hypothetical protein n=1 Tax=Hydrogenophaga sp. TaxID=1904254 RepID=UPI002FC991FD